MGESPVSVAHQILYEVFIACTHLDVHHKLADCINRNGIPALLYLILHIAMTFLLSETLREHPSLTHRYRAAAPSVRGRPSHVSYLAG